MTDDAPQLHDAEAPRWRPPFGLLGLIVLAWVVYEATHSPALASVLVSLKFGWEEFLTARWLRLRDPDPRRGRSLFWLYASWGVWKCATVAGLMAGAFTAIAFSTPNRWALDQSFLAALSTLLTAVFGFAVSKALEAAAAMLARRGQCRLWLDSGVNGARHRDCWPPTPYCFGRNRLDLLIYTASYLALAVVFPFLGLIGMCILGMWLTNLEVFILCVILSVVFLIGAHVYQKAVSAQVWAISPEECWPEPWDLPPP